MISKECFTEGWIERVSSEMKYPDKNLIEKVIRAFSLVELLVESGCSFVDSRNDLLNDSQSKDFLKF